MITETYPATIGDGPFVLPELRAMRGKFRVTLVCLKEPVGDGRKAPD